MSNSIRISPSALMNGEDDVAIRELRSSDIPEMQSIGQALNACRNGLYTAAQKRWLGLIEKRRAELLRIKKHILVVDYGAGMPGDQRTPEQMEAGVRETRAVGEICRTNSKSEFWARILFKLVLSLKPTSCIELGSCLGISAAYQASALRLNGRGCLTTLEGSPEVAKLAGETLQELGLDNASVVTGPFRETLEGVLARCKPVDYFFNDGHHDGDAVLEYYSQSLSMLSERAVFVFDNIAWSPSMREAWNILENDRHVVASVDLTDVGVAIVECG